MNENVNPLNRIEMIKTMLDKVVDSTGRMRCSYICAIDEFLDRLRDDVLIMEEKINDFEKLYKEGPGIQNGTET